PACALLVPTLPVSIAITPTLSSSLLPYTTLIRSATSCTLAAGTCSVTYTPTVVGHALITGTYPGDSVHTGSSGTFTLASTKRATTTTVNCSTASILDNTPSTCTVTVADSSGAGAV